METQCTLGWDEQDRITLQCWSVSYYLFQVIHGKTDVQKSGSKDDPFDVTLLYQYGTMARYSMWPLTSDKNSNKACKQNSGSGLMDKDCFTSVPSFCKEEDSSGSDYLLDSESSQSQLQGLSDVGSRPHV